MNDRIPYNLRGPVMAAFYGGLSFPFLLNVVTEAVLADISGAYPWAYVDLGLHSFDVATRLDVRDVTDEVRSLDGDELRRRLLKGGR